MGAGVKTGLAGHSRRRGRKRHAAMSEINVTPMVDVMLVLLIIFMVAAPLLLSGLPVDLPPSGKGSPNLDKDTLTVTVDRSGNFFVGSREEAVGLDQVTALLKANAKNGTNDQVLFRGDRQVPYGRVSEAMNAVRTAGFKNFVFVQGPEDIEKGPAKGR